MQNQVAYGTEPGALGRTKRRAHAAAYLFRAAASLGGAAARGGRRKVKDGYGEACPKGAASWKRVIASDSVEEEENEDVCHS